jgi:hypothetical protein
VNERIPILYDRALRPEWIDFALEQYLRATDEDALRKVLCDYLRPQIQGAETVNKTARQLQRTAGFKSSLSRERLAEIHCQMSAVSPDQRAALRLQLLVESTPFVEDCLTAMKRLALLGVKGVEIKHIYERLVAKYGDRSMVYRRVRYVLQTLALLGIVEYRDKRWFLLDALSHIS